MENTRRLRLESAIRQELSMIIPQGVKDPRVPSLTITRVELTNDAAQATVHISTMNHMSDDEKDSKNESKECLKGLSAAKGYLRKHLAKNIRMRHVPDLLFKQDKGLENTLRIHQILDQLKKDEPKSVTIGAGDLEETLNVPAAPVGLKTVKNPGLPSELAAN